MSNNIVSKKKLDIKVLDGMTNQMVAEPQLPMPSRSLLIGHEIGGEIISQRPKDGYINATALCKVAGKKFNDYYRLSSTKAFIQALVAETGIPVSALIQILKGGNQPSLQGTWIHPQVAIHLAQWLSPQFAVQVSKWVFEWMTGQVSGYMPDHVKRYIKNRTKIPHTHFSMLNEIFLNLLAPLEDVGFSMPNKMIPDISTGRMFSEFLRKKGLHPEDFDTYEHEFTNGRQNVRARLYPIDLLADFRRFFNEEWLPSHAKRYFKERAPKALPYINRITPLELSGSKRKKDTK